MSIQSSKVFESFRVKCVWKSEVLLCNEQNINKRNNPTVIIISNIQAVYKSDGVRKDPFKVGTSKIEIFCGRTDTITFC